jgi:colanic acid/amylovoran biosynthesis glycosyltransferase
MKLGIFTKNHGFKHNTFIRRYCEDLTANTPIFARYVHDSDWNRENLIRLSFEKRTKYRAAYLTNKISNLFSQNKTQDLWAYNLLCKDEIEEAFHKSNITHLLTQYVDSAIHLDPICKKLGIKHIARGHGYDITQSPKSDWGHMYYHRANQLDAIIVPTPHQINVLRENGITRPNIYHHACGTDIPLSNSYDLRSDNKNNKIRFIAVGRFVDKKAPMETIQAFLVAAKANKNMELIMIGDGKLYNECVDLIKESGAHDQIKLLGAMKGDEVISEMKKSDVFLQHSVTASNGDQEGAPVAISEAMSLGLPVISTKHSGIPFMVENEVTGLLVKEYDRMGMAQAMIKLSLDQELRLKISKAAYNYAKQNLSWQSEKSHILNWIKAL